MATLYTNKNNIPLAIRDEYELRADGLYGPKAGTWRPELEPEELTKKQQVAIPGQYFQMGNTAIAGATQTAQQQLGNVNALSGRVNQYITSGHRDLQQAEFGVQQSRAGVTQAADNLSGYATALMPYAQKMGALGDAFVQDASVMRSQAQPWLQQGSDMLGMRATTGMGAEWQKLYSSLSPDALTSFAAAAASQSSDASRGEMVRQLSRMGVSPGSGTMAEALSKVKKAEETLLSSVKTQAHLLGLDKQREALAQGLQMALAMTGEGATLMDMVRLNQGAAVQAHQGAAATVSASGSMEASAGQLHQAAANLSLALGTMSIDDARTAIAAFQAQTGAGQSAVNALIASSQMAAEYYSTQASSILGLLTRAPNSNISGMAIA